MYTAAEKSAPGSEADKVLGFFSILAHAAMASLRSNKK